MISFDEMMNALAAIQRRNLMRARLEHNPPTDAPASIAEPDRDDGGEDRLVSMQIDPHPKLAALGFIAWDNKRHEVTKGPNFGEIRPLLDLMSNQIDELPDDWV